MGAGVAPGGTLFSGRAPPDRPGHRSRDARGRPGAGLVEAAVAALDLRRWEFVVAEDRPRAAAGTGVDAVIRARPSGLTSQRDHRPHRRNAGSSHLLLRANPGVSAHLYLLLAVDLPHRLGRSHKRIFGFGQLLLTKSSHLRAALAWRRLRALRAERLGCARAQKDPQAATHGRSHSFLSQDGADESHGDETHVSSAASPWSARSFDVTAASIGRRLRARSGLVYMIASVSRPVKVALRDCLRQGLTALLDPRFARRGYATRSGIELRLGRSSSVSPTSRDTHPRTRCRRPETSEPVRRCPADEALRPG